MTSSLAKMFDLWTSTVESIVLVRCIHAYVSYCEMYNNKHLIIFWLLMKSLCYV